MTTLRAITAGILSRLWRAASAVARWVSALPDACADSVRNHISYEEAQKIGAKMLAFGTTGGGLTKAMFADSEFQALAMGLVLALAAGAWEARRRLKEGATITGVPQADAAGPVVVGLVTEPAPAEMPSTETSP